MRPLAVLNAIVFGSAAAITFGLGGVLVIFLVLQGQSSGDARGISCPGSQQRAVCTAGRGLRARACSRLLKGLRWRWLAHVAMWLVIAGIATIVLAAVSGGTWGKPPKVPAVRPGAGRGS